MQRWQCPIHIGTLETLILINYVEKELVLSRLKNGLILIIYQLFLKKTNAQVTSIEKPQMKIIKNKT